MHSFRPRKQRKFWNSNVLIFVGMVIVAYQLFVYAKKVYQDYQIDQQIATYQEDIDSLTSNNEEMKELIEYLQTDAYREKVAKGIVGLKNPGEEVIVIKGDNPATDDQASDSEAALYTLTNPQKWWEYFFGIRKRTRNADSNS